MTIKRRDLHNIFQKFSGWRHFYAFEHQKPGFIDNFIFIILQKITKFFKPAYFYYTIYFLLYRNVLTFALSML